MAHGHTEDERPDRVDGPSHRPVRGALRHLVVVLVLALGVAVLSAVDPGAGQASPSTPSTPSSAATHRSRPHAPPVLQRVGISLPLNKLAGFIRTTGSVPDQLSIYQQWATRRPFDSVAANAAKKRGMRILVNWEPWAPQCDCADQPKWTNRVVAGGAYDTYIKKYARSVKAFTSKGGHVTLRLAHEMNGNWYPWAVGANGNTAKSYIAMWRHVYRVFTAQKVPNVRWMWSPNVVYTGSVPMGTPYPGGKYVNDVGLSGYNFGAGHGFHWETFAAVYQDSIDQLRKVAPHKPLYLAEVGCAPRGGNKAKWIARLFRQVKQRPYIAGLTWFEQRTQRNWLIEDSAADIRAWKTGVALLQTH